MEVEGDVGDEQFPQHPSLDFPPAITQPNSTLFPLSQPTHEDETPSQLMVKISRHTNGAAKSLGLEVSGNGTGPTSADDDRDHLAQVAAATGPCHSLGSAQGPGVRTEDIATSSTAMGVLSHKTLLTVTESEDFNLTNQLSSCAPAADQSDGHEIEQNFSVSQEKMGPEILAVPEDTSVEDHINTVRAIRGSRVALILPMYMKYRERLVPLKVLVDTGCEVDLVRTGLIDSGLFFPTEKNIRLVTANGSLLGGGSKQTRFNLMVKANPISHIGEPKILVFPTTFVEANIQVDVILSFKWLVEFDLDIKCRDYGLQTNTRPLFFIPGIEGTSQKVCNVSLRGEDWKPKCLRIAASFEEAPYEDKPYWDIVNNPEAFMFPREISQLRRLQLRAFPELESEHEWEDNYFMPLLEMASDDEGEGDQPAEIEDDICFAQSVVLTHNPITHPQASEIKEKILSDFSETVFRQKNGPHTPGSRSIWGSHH